MKVTNTICLPAYASNLPKSMQGLHPARGSVITYFPEFRVAMDNLVHDVKELSEAHRRLTGSRFLDLSGLGSVLTMEIIWRKY